MLLGVVGFFYVYLCGSFCTFMSIFLIYFLLILSYIFVCFYIFSILICRRVNQLIEILFTDTLDHFNRLFSAQPSIILHLIFKQELLSPLIPLKQVSFSPLKLSRLNLKPFLNDFFFFLVLFRGNFVIDKLFSDDRILLLFLHLQIVQSLSQSYLNFV